LITIGILKNAVQDYAWGSRTDIPDLLGEPVTGKPQAELWMGAHPKAPSLVFYDGTWRSLLDLIEAFPIEMLGQQAAEKFGKKLPYLFKVLAAAEPLSVQAHPNASQAREGFARENRLEIPLTAAHRNYKDDNHKPECICALTDFWGMNSFRRISEIITNLSALSGHILDNEIDLLKKQPTAIGLKELFQSLLSLPEDRKQAAIAAGVSHAESSAEKADPVSMWIRRLHDAYPSDIGALFPAILNLYRLTPGQALFLAAGEPHAYLEGLGIELMANSDNVLRGGLTKKHLDVPELIHVLTFQEQEPSVILPQLCNAVEWIYETPADEFRLTRLSLTPGRRWVSHDDRSIDILLCTQGQLSIGGNPAHEPVSLKKGMSAVVPAAVGAYHIDGVGVCYKASVPGPPGFVLDMQTAET